MTRKPNFAKCILGLFVLAILFIGTWATTNVTRSTAQEKDQGKLISPKAKPTLPPPPSPPAAVDHVFEIEGNAVDESAPGEDWDLINPEDGLSRTGPVAGSNVQSATFVADITNDTYFTGGSSKDFIDIEGNWQITDTSVPDKDEIGHAYAATYLDNSADCAITDTCGHKVLVFGGDRLATNGDANIGFWFFKGEVSVDLVNNVFHGSHQNGDLFIVSAFTQGGGSSVIDVYEWVGTPNPADLTETNLDRCDALGGVLDLSGDDTICKVTSAGKATGIVNPEEILLDWPYTPKGGDVCDNDPDDCPAAAGAFYEGGIDLTELGLEGTCFSSFLLETRSSQSVDAVLKDFALGEFESCSGGCSKLVSPSEICLGDSATYTYSVSNTGTGTIQITSVKDDAHTPGDTSDDFFVNGLAVGGGTCTTSTSTFTPFNLAAGQTATCTLTVMPAVGVYTNVVTAEAESGGQDVPLECNPASATLTVRDKPSVTISVLTCPFGAQTSFNLTATATGGTPPYRISMGGDACGGAGEPACDGASQNMLTINRTVGGAYTATVTDSSNLTNCTATATRNVGYCSDGP